jgi:ComF family protein
MLFVEKALSFLAPHDCLVCGREGSLMCLGCAYDSFEPVPDRCYRCLRLSRDSAVCQKCRQSTVLKHVWVATEYDSHAKELVRLLKFERTKAAHRPIAQEIARILPYLAKDTVVTHVPTATSRERARGYDQSYLVARVVASEKKLKHTTLLARHGQSRQVGSTRKQRQDQAKNMFSVRNIPNIKNAHILLVDDILTTGASLEAAAKQLKMAGAKQVNAVVFAQKH